MDTGSGEAQLGSNSTVCEVLIILLFVFLTPRALLIRGVLVSMLFIPIFMRTFHFIDKNLSQVLIKKKVIMSKQAQINLSEALAERVFNHVSFSQFSAENQGQVVGELLDIRQKLLLISHFSTFQGLPAHNEWLVKLNSVLDRLNSFLKNLNNAV